MRRVVIKNNKNTGPVSTHYQVCNLCEAICGLEIKVQQNEIISIKGDKEDPFSKGHICPKAVALQDIYNDPDRLQQPVKKTADGWETISWEQAFDEVALKLKKTQRDHGKDAVAIYLGNPVVHNLEALLYAPAFVRSLQTENRYSATSVDQLPEQIVSLLMFGHGLLVPVPDLDRTQYLIIFGANPVVSNGSMMTAPGVKKRLKSIQSRQGKIVVIDPRKTETATLADQHLFIKPGTDVLMMLAMLNVVFDESLQSMGHLNSITYNLEQVIELVKDYEPESVAKHTGVGAEAIKQLVRDFCQSESASCYGRIGVSTQEFGSLTQWLITVFNIVTGNLDVEGGAMFSTPAISVLKKSRGNQKGFADKHSRVRQLPDFAGEFPVVALAEEIMTEGDGQIKSLVTVAGNPILSTPNGRNLDKAFSELDFMVSVDFYINETTRHADIILPPLSSLERHHYDLIFHHLAVQNTSKYSEPLFKPKSHQRSDAAIFTELSWRMQSDDRVDNVEGLSNKKAILNYGTEQIIDDRLKAGAYGKSHQLSIEKLKNNPHGIDLGALKSCLPERLLTDDKKINLAPEELLADVERLKIFIEKQDKAEKNEFDLLLIGRRDPRTNNSWLHNSQRMVKGKNRCIAKLNPNDASSRNISEGDAIKVKSRVGEIELEVAMSDEIMEGVISIPHGWGHNFKDIELSIATNHPGVNCNILTDELFLDQLSGNAALNGVPVSVEAAN